MCLRDCSSRPLSLDLRRNSSGFSYIPENIRQILNLVSESENEMDDSMSWSSQSFQDEREEAFDGPHTALLSRETEAGLFYEEERQQALDTHDDDNRLLPM